MVFLEGDVIFYQIFLISPIQCTVTHCRNCKRLCDFEEKESQDISVEVILNNKEETN
jgi:hypothetical protein